LCSVVPIHAQEFHDPGVYLKAHRVDVKIDNQLATTRVEQVFVNESERPAEGTYIFPLPKGAAVSDLIMYVDGEPIQAKILNADEARDIYEEIVRQLRDPALLEYVGRDAIQASVFPIQPHDEVKIEIEYNHILPVENGLVRYVYPLRTDQFTKFPVQTLSVNVEVTSNDEISSVYSPSHRIAVSREDDLHFRAGYEATHVHEVSDFVLYYGLASETVNVNLLSYRESANEPGFFVLLVAPPVSTADVRVAPKDVIIVLDQSGSMFGEKWDQAREASRYVLDNLNAEDRFNIVSFSTGWRIYSNELEGLSEVEDAKQWVSTLEAVGGTDIDGGLKQAFSMADPARQTVILFLTDGVPTEGETDVEEILDNAEANAPEKIRIFTFGVGDDVDTFLLDRLNEIFRGAGTYVRPHERIDEEVSVLYNKISSPVMTNLELAVEGEIMLEDMYPGQPLPDLFLGSQLIIAGRYRGEGTATVTLTGEVNGEKRTFVYDNLDFRENAGGESMIPRLWATRKIGALMNSIRLNGENPELVDSIVRLSLRYGIITPYTSFLIEENDIFTQQGVQDAATRAEEDLGTLNEGYVGAGAVSAADDAAELEKSEVAAAPMQYATNTPGDGAGGEVAPQFGQSTETLRVAGDRTFVLRDGIWIDTTYEADTMTPTEIAFLSDDYFALLDAYPEIGIYLSLGDHLILVLDGEAYEIKPS
ncbi:MAG: VWA domain-containing protein, partial [Anaerolineae bacterium]|nr:VWA domain-containing protein [Anaerolineae bacterium]